MNDELVINTVLAILITSVSVHVKYLKGYLILFPDTASGFLKYFISSVLGKTSFENASQRGNEVAFTESRM